MSYRDWCDRFGDPAWYVRLYGAFAIGAGDVAVRIAESGGGLGHGWDRTEADEKATMPRGQLALDV